MRKKITVGFLTETAVALRYREVDAKGEHIHGDQEGALVGDLYLRKVAMPKKAPEKITVTLEF